MCGIAGQIVFNAGEQSQTRLSTALTAMQHRGPDGRDVLRTKIPGGVIDLGHVRLSIIDLSNAGQQPMTTPDGRYTIVFNGELYNYVELRKELSQKGHRFSTESDTEVLLAAWAEWNLSCLEYLDGMFAFAVLDHEQKQLFCVRDAFGIKPFFYTVQNDGFYFASELAPLLKLLPETPEIDSQAAYDYLLWGKYDTSERCFHQGIKQLQPGYWMQVGLDPRLSVTVKKWWNPDTSQHCDLNFDDAVDQVRTLFLSSVRRQLRSDVPLGVTLSGGVDSSAIVCAMRHLEPDLPIHTFTYTPESSHLNERKWAQLVVDHVGAIAHWTDYPADEMGEDLETIMRAQGEPFGSTSIAASFCVFRLARENGITVTLDGQGADEVLGGYEGYPAAVFKSYLERHEYLELLAFIKSWSKWPGRSVKRGMVHLGDAIVPNALRRFALRAAGYDANPAWLDVSAFREAGVAVSVPDSDVRTSGEKGRRLIGRLQTATQSNNLPALLRHGDRNSMHWSIESRVPFLSPDLVRFMYSLPEDWLVSRQGETKHIFRHAMRGIMPDAILDRRDKIGFQTPEQQLLSGQRTRIWKWLEAAEQFDFLKVDQVRQEVEAALDGKSAYRRSTWRLINFCAWAYLGRIGPYLK